MAKRNEVYKCDACGHIVELLQEGMGELDDRGIPKTIEGYTKLNAIQAATDKTLTQILFGEAGKTIQVRSPTEAAELVPLYQYDAERDAFTSRETGIEYQNIRGTYTSPTGTPILPGFIAGIGTTNFKNFFTSPALRGPLVRIITWNFAFAFFSLLFNFGLGLAIAILFNDKNFPFKKLIRSLLLIPYTVPALITILIWRGMYNTELGVINEILTALFNWAPDWFNNGTWAKIAILIVNLWLSYPYFMLICSGALQSISEDYYAAAQVDGANAWQRFWKVTWPLSLPGVYAGSALVFIPVLGMFAVPDILGGTGDILIGNLIKEQFLGTRDWPFGSTLSIMLTLMVLASAALAMRFSRKALAHA